MRKALKASVEPIEPTQTSVGNMTDRTGRLMEQAADEIERLRKEAAYFRHLLNIHPDWDLDSEGAREQIARNTRKVLGNR